MGDMTAHFSRREFTCKCGFYFNNVKTKLVEYLEKVYEYLDNTADGISAIYINSGCRCSKHSLSVGGYMNDAHTKGIAADFYALKKDGRTRWGAYELAAVCEKIGFSGIGIIQDGATSAIHADIRDANNYVNSHWFGNEITKDNNVKTFLSYLPPQKATAETPTNTKEKHKLTITLDGVKIYEKEFD